MWSARWTALETVGLLQPGRLKHLQELAFRSHVDGLRHQLAFAVKQETVRDSFDAEGRVYLPVGSSITGKV